MTSAAEHLGEAWQELVAAIRVAFGFPLPNRTWEQNLREAAAAWQKVVDRSTGVQRERALRVLRGCNRALADAVANPRDPNDRRPIQGGQTIEPG